MKVTAHCEVRTGAGPVGERVRESLLSQGFGVPVGGWLRQLGKVGVCASLSISRGRRTAGRDLSGRPGMEGRPVAVSGG